MDKIENLSQYYQSLSFAKSVIFLQLPSLNSLWEGYTWIFKHDIEEICENTIFSGGEGITHPEELFPLYFPPLKKYRYPWAITSHTLFLVKVYKVGQCPKYKTYLNGPYSIREYIYHLANRTPDALKSLQICSIS